RPPILIHVDDVPGHAHDVLRSRAALGQNSDDVLQCLPRLRDEACGEPLVRVPSDHATDEDHFALRLHAVGIAFRLRPPGRLQYPSPLRRRGRLLQHCSPPAFCRQLLDGTVGHVQSPQDASLWDAFSLATRRNSNRCSLPVWVFGNSLTYSIARGYL